eukprot:3602760-Rhodomonas_salina.3
MQRHQKPQQGEGQQGERASMCWKKMKAWFNAGLVFVRACVCLRVRVRAVQGRAEQSEEDLAGRGGYPAVQRKRGPNIVTFLKQSNGMMIFEGEVR